MLQKATGSSMFPRLFEPGFIGSLRLKNRLIKAPTATNLSTTNGCVTDRMIRYYSEIARGGIGLIIVEFAYIDEKASKGSNNMLGVSCDYHRTGLEWLASSIKMNGASAGLQIVHVGNERALPGAKTVTRYPWITAKTKNLPAPQELTFEELKEIVEAFGDAAFRAKAAGFDIVEIHGAHGYLITNSLSPKINRRTDWYGGSLTNRMRLLLEIVENVRGKVGQEYPLSVRLSGTDYSKEDPITIEETKEVAKALEAAGVNTIHVSCGTHSVNDKEVVRMYWPVAFNIWAAEAIKKVVSIPVIASGSLTSPQLAEEVLKDKKGDFVSFARPILADPYFPMKAKEGRPEDIRPCIRCCDGCLKRAANTVTLCSVNVSLGKEEEFKITPARKPKKVAIVGGGPAGMEAARVAALRGHKVTLFEKRKLGGMLIEASVPPFKSDIRPLISYFVAQIQKTGIEVKYSEATIKTIKSGNFNAVVVASGSIAASADITGCNEPYVISDLDVLHGAKTGKTVLIVGGGMIGSDVALFLAEQGKNVIITTRGKEIADDMEEFCRVAFLERLSKQKATIYTGLRLESIVNSTAVFRDLSDRKQEIVAETIVLSRGRLPNSKLFDKLSVVHDLECYAVGDCVKPGMIYDAVHDGFRAAYQI